MAPRPTNETRSVVSLHLPRETYVLVKRAAKKAKLPISRYIRDAAFASAEKDLQVAA